MVRLRIIKISPILSILCGDSPKVSINKCPRLFLPHHQHQNTQKQQRYHRNQFFFLLRVRDSRRDYGLQPFRQSSWKVSSNTKLFHLVFGFTFFSLVMDYSRVLFKPSRPQLFLDFFLSFSFFSFPHIIIFLVLLILFSPVLIVSMLINFSLSLSLPLCGIFSLVANNVEDWNWKFWNVWIL